MRAKKSFTYYINKLPKIPEIFSFIQEKSGLSDKEMYGTFNMGVGFAVFALENQVDKIINLAKSCDIIAWNAGFVEKGKKQIVIEEKQIVYKEESLNLRI